MPYVEMKSMQVCTGTLNPRVAADIRKHTSSDSYPISCSVNNNSAKTESASTTLEKHLVYNHT